MTYEITGPGALNYWPCQFGTSKLNFRGPARSLDAPYIAFLGGTTTFGKFIEQPYPLLVEHLTGVACINLGQINAGPDVFAYDKTVLGIADAARVTVLEVLGAGNMSNPFFHVHKRRNDRFVHARPALTRLYPDVDFTRFAFTRHMLLHLHECDAVRFSVVLCALRKTWVKRMKKLLGRIRGHTVLVRFDAASDPYGSWITDDMLDQLGALASARITVNAGSTKIATANRGLVYPPEDEGAAHAVLQPNVHTAAAQALWPVLDRLM